ncbi:MULTISPECIES: NADPH:quinone reductase [Streptomyces]|uniref:NADPH2:quinone reductase n=2 Tax=Streptomyces griseoaurantiacus TaxID=68213 RepID=A0A1G7C4G0_9ACTN|nr:MULTISPECIES: NADPH:quinone reductase [Streptomyces]MBA5222663.1 NADPH:quinone reductase [Streptomyces griseoaurantiacus]MDX3091595.1 NADPH:quinone reductase [Streptomyces sp. ME12-02E]MDX3335051.1 NADPH:quinone reductase [Streptomyces sp. ME02-6978a]MDX3363338.1 NADPH:quinone reductase [Streptomyces sp. ME02-6978.2a]NJP69606.1 NADPH:quinone reductase [Streptomyces sp. C1-2]
MRASWYDRQGPAADVLRLGELPDPRPGPGEVRVRVSVSGVNPGDTKKRRGWLGSAMPYPRVVPHSDAAGVVDAVGEGVDARRTGQRVWVYGAQSYRPFGTAAQYTVVPAGKAVPLPDHVGDDLGACLGIPGITAHRAVFGDGPVDGRTVLVHGVLGGVGSLAARLARWGGARVLGTVRRGTDLDRVDPDVVHHTVALDEEDPAAAIRALAPGGVHRIVEVSLSANADLDNAVLANGAVIAAYATEADRTGIPFWPLLFGNVTLRLLGSDDFPEQARRQAARDLTAAAAAGVLTTGPVARYALHDLARAHERVDAGGGVRVLVDLPRP